jgi:hypothetical protein
MRLALPALFFAILWFALRKKPDRALRAKLQKIDPDQGNTCALCQGTLIMDHQWRCSHCGAERTTISLA